LNSRASPFTRGFSHSSGEISTFAGKLGDSGSATGASLLNRDQPSIRQDGETATCCGLVDIGSVGEFTEAAVDDLHLRRMDRGLGRKTVTARGVCLAAQGVLASAIRLDSTFEPIFSTATSAARQKSVRRPRRRARSRRFRKEIHRRDGSRRRRFASGRSMPPAWPAQRVRMSQPAFCFEFDWRSRPAIPQRRLADTTQRKARCTIAEAKC
jgi:hypothetical protein